jgi:hypothetical protein
MPRIHTELNSGEETQEPGRCCLHENDTRSRQIYLSAEFRVERVLLSSLVRVSLASITIIIPDY